MPEISHCGECGSVLPDYWPKGLCPQCALAGVLEEPMEADQILEVVDRETTIRASLPKTNDGSEKSRFIRFGDHELMEEIGRGGMGVIYRARQVSLNRTVALKMILAGQFASKQEVLRFRAEAEAAANLQHPHIVRIHETGERDGHHYFSMDYVEGKTLAEFVRDGPLAARQAAKYARSIAEAIHYAHLQGVLHRDLKPSNVIIDGNDQPRITDFGLAKRVHGEFGMTVTGQVIGSPNFMPPEQTAAHRGKVGPASDVYGVGAILYYLLTGRPPFHAETIGELMLLLRDADPVSPRLLNPSVSRDLETICLKCLEKDPARRYATAEMLADELGRFIRDEPIQARPLRAIGKFWRWCRRRPAIAALSASVFLLLMIVAVSSSIAAWRVSRARASEQRANRELRDTVNSLELQRAENFFRNGDGGTAVAHLAAMLRRDPANYPVASRLISALVHRDWALRTSVEMRHADQIDTLEFSPNAGHVLSAGRDHSARIWEAKTGKTVAVLQHGGRVFCAHYDSKGGRIVTASEDGTARIWDSETGEPSTPPLQHADKVYWAEFSADDRWVVTASADATARIWDASTGALLRELRKHTSHVVLARLSRDSRIVATCGSHASIRIWRADSGEMLFRVEDRSSPVVAMDVSPDGTRLFALCHDEVVRLWDLETRTEISSPMEKEAVTQAAFSPDGRLLVTCGHDATARFWDAKTGLPAGSPLVHEGTVTSARFSRDGQKIVTLSRDHSARIWDVQTRRLVCQPIRKPEEFAHADFSRDGAQLVTAGSEGIIHVWDLQPRRFTGLKARFDTAITSIDFSREGERLLATAFDGTARVFDARTFKILASLPHEMGLYLARFNPAGDRVFTACAGKVRFWDWRKGVMVAGPFEHATGIDAFDFNLRGDEVVTGASDGTARVWKVAEWEPITPPLKHSGRIAMVRFSPDGRLIVTASNDHTARVWDAATGMPVTQPLLHKDHVKSAEFSPDGKCILTASTDDTACVWDVRSGQRVIPPLQHTRIVEKAHFSPDGSRIATASLDCTARIWDIRTGFALTAPMKHDCSVVDVSIGRGGESVMTGCWNGALRVWNAQNGQPMTESLGAEDWSLKFVCLNRVSQRMATGGKDAVVRLWHFPVISTPVPEWFLTLSEAVAGMRLGDPGQLELVLPTQLEGLSQDSKSGDKNDFYARLAEWFLADPADREPAPF